VDESLRDEQSERPLLAEPGPAGDDRSALLRLRQGVEWQHVDDEVVALDLNSSAYLAVNDTGAALWPLVAEGTTEEELIEKLTTSFDVDIEQARSDVGAFVEQLRTFTLLDER
jgi:hypothetical protein